MKINFLILFVLITITLGITFLTGENTPQKNSAGNAPGFSYTTLDNKKGKLSQHKDRIVVLHFWATWCAPCLVEFPTLIDLAKNKDNITVLAIAVKDQKEDIERFLIKTGKNIPENMIIAQDKNKKISEKLFGTFKLPETYVITGGNTISEKVVGPQKNWDSSDWHDTIDHLSSE